MTERCTHQIKIPTQMSDSSFTYDCPTCGELCHREPEQTRGGEPEFMGFHERMNLRNPVWPADGTGTGSLALD